MASEVDLWEPFKSMKKMRRRMFDMFSWPEGFPGIRQPLVDIEDKGKSLQVVAELPGMEKKDIDINLEETSLEIKAAAKQEARQEKKKQGYFFHERSYQSFFRSIPLPAEIIPSKAKAMFKNGILTINMPKKHAAKKRKGHRVKVE